MPEIIAGKKAYTLLDLAQSIQRMFTAHFNRNYWVKAEINKLNYYSRTGHCHPELLQKENDKVVVEFKSILWNIDYERINRLVLEHIKEALTD
ncbi:MAG: exodeoxyribonuclease VII large subunit, partial [Flavobacteriales bacterium]